MHRSAPGDPPTSPPLSHTRTRSLLRPRRTDLSLGTELLVLWLVIVVPLELVPEHREPAWSRVDAVSQELHMDRVCVASSGHFGGGWVDAGGGGVRTVELFFGDPRQLLDLDHQHREDQDDLVELRRRRR